MKRLLLVAILVAAGCKNDGGGAPPPTPVPNPTIAQPPATVVPPPSASPSPLACNGGIYGVNVGGKITCYCQNGVEVPCPATAKSLKVGEKKWLQ